MRCYVDGHSRDSFVSISDKLVIQCRLGDRERFYSKAQNPYSFMATQHQSYRPSLKNERYTLQSGEASSEAKRYVFGSGLSEPEFDQLR